MYKRIHKIFSVDKVTFFVSTSLAIIAILAIHITSQVRAVHVSNLPEGNLLLNPWFRNIDKPSVSGLQYWTDASSGSLLWSTSQKSSNPTPDSIVSGKCGGSSEQYCGTSARFANGRGQGGGGAGQSGIDAYLYQVVSADPTLNTLRFKTHWVTGEIIQAKVTIYGSETATGPWAPVWIPFEVDSTSGSSYAWTETEVLEQNIDQAWSYYKVELHGKYPSGTSQGVKYTGVYFSVVDDNGIPNTPTSTPIDTEFTPTPTIVSEVTLVPTLVDEPNETTLAPLPSATLTPTPTIIQPGNNTAPVIRTNYLNPGTAGQSYSFNISGYDNNLGDTFSMTAAGLPGGLTISVCSTNVVSSQMRIICGLSGVPTATGTYNPTITLTDQFGASTSKIYKLIIN